ncbi:MAG: hypothetical protein AABX11_04330 [Nanoarchaeota archaeon]
MIPPTEFPVKDKLEKRVTTELKLRISRGYTNINLSLIKFEIDKVLSELNVI